MQQEYEITIRTCLLIENMNYHTIIFNIFFAQQGQNGLKKKMIWKKTCQDKCIPGVSNSRVSAS